MWVDVPINVPIKLPIARYTNRQMMVTMASGKFVSYLRVSTERQGRSGLGLEAQRHAVTEFLDGGRWQLIAEFVEVETGKDDNRPKLREALHLAKVTGATLVIAKLDRLSRNLAFIANLQESRAKFVCADMPDANELTIHLFAAMAQHERKLISTRTKAALAAAKRRGVKMGNPNGAAAIRRAGKGNKDAVRAIKAAADRHAQDILPIVADIEANGIISLEGIATELNRRGILTTRGGKYYATTVSRLVNRAI
jgi:DNA invertase Pin-like site-specific DNA recombinase